MCNTDLPQHLTVTLPSETFAKCLRVGTGLKDEYRRTDSPSSSLSAHFRPPLAISCRTDEHVRRARTYNERGQARVSPEGQICNPPNIRYIYGDER